MLLLRILPLSRRSRWTSLEHMAAGNAAAVNGSARRHVQHLGASQRSAKSQHGWRAAAGGRVAVAGGGWRQACVCNRKSLLLRLRRMCAVCCVCCVCCACCVSVWRRRRRKEGGETERLCLFKPDRLLAEGPSPLVCEHSFPDLHVNHKRVSCGTTCPKPPTRARCRSLLSSRPQQTPRARRFKTVNISCFVGCLV